MSNTAWPTITDVDSIAAAMNVNFGTAVSDNIKTMVLNSVISYTENKTKRKFLPFEDTKYYDGNDKGEIEIDEFITIKSVTLLGWYGITSGITLDSVKPILRDNFPNTRIQIYQGSLPSAYRQWVDKFPAGRSNVQISATFGYGTAVPDDLWLGVLLQATGIAINLTKHSNEGYLIKWEEAGVTEVRQFLDPFKLFKSSGATSFGKLINQYRKPSSYFTRKTEFRMIG